MKRTCEKAFSFCACDKIFLDLPKIFYGASSQNLMDRWSLEKGGLPPGVRLLNGGIVFGFAPMTQQKLSYAFMVKHGKDMFFVHIEIKALLDDFASRPRKNTFTKNNYMQWGFGKNLTEEEGRDQAFYIKMHDLTPPLFSEFVGPEKLKTGESPIKIKAFEASVKACRDIADRYKDLSLCFSGGVDSMAMLTAFLHAKVPFKIVIWRDKNNLITDSDLACLICEKQGLPYEFVHLDALDFFESGEYLLYCQKYKIFSGIELALHIKFLENTAGTPVLAGEQPLRGFFNGFSSAPQGCQFPDYELSCFERYFIQSGRSAVPRFLTYSMDQTKAFIQAEHCMAFTPIYHRKCLLYKISDWPFDPFYTKKHTGSEKIREHYREKTGDKWFFDNHFRPKVYLERQEAEAYRGCTQEGGFLYFPLNLRNINPDANMGFSRFLRG